MYSKLCLLALAVAVQASWDGAKPSHHHGHHHGHYHPSGGIFPPSGSVAPFPTGASTQHGVFPTGTAAGSATGAGPEPTGDTTLTYTITANGQPTTVTTTIHHTKYHTDFVYAHQSEAPAEKDVNGGSVTQTIHITSTSTHFITEYASSTSAAAPEEKVVAPASAAGSGGCAVQSTVTVQGPEVTVTVTAPAEEAAPTGGVEGNAPESQAQGPGSEIPPYPIPSSKKHKTKCASTGFITKSAKATASGGLGPLPTGSGGFIHPVPLASGIAPIEKVKKGKN